MNFLIPRIANLINRIDNLSDKDAIYLLGIILTKTKLQMRIEAEQNVTANKTTTKQNKTKRTKQ